MRKRFKISDFEESCNNEMLTQEDDAEDKDGNYNVHEVNEDAPLGSEPISILGDGNCYLRSVLKLGFD